MADIQVPSIAAVTPAAADTVLGVQGGAVKRFSISALPFTQAGTGAVARTALAKMKETVSVLDFGATGNGTTDDTAAIQAAIDAVSVAGGVVVVPPGTYSLTVQATDTINGTSVKRCLEITAGGIEIQLCTGAVLKVANGQASGTENLCIIRLGTTAGAAVSGIRISGPGKIDGNQANQTAVSTYYLLGSAIFAFGEVTGIDIDGVEISDHIGDAICFYGVSSVARVGQARVRNCYIHDIYEGVVWQNADYVRVEKNRLTNMTGQDAIEPAANTDYWWVEDNFIDTVGAGNSGIDIFKGTRYGVCRGNILIDCDIDVGAGATVAPTDIVVADNILNNGNILVAGGASRITIANNHVRSPSAHGINVVVGSEVVIRGNIVSDGLYCGIKLNSAGADYCVIDGNLVVSNGRSGTAGATAGIMINNNTATVVSNNMVIDTQETATQGFTGGIEMIGATGASVMGNHIRGNIEDMIDYQSTTDCRVGYNKGHVTENSGTATVASGTTAINVAHGLSNTNVALKIKDIHVTPINSMGNATKFYVSIVNATTFKITVNADPGATTAMFAWRVARTATD